jgi:hypothetical protein
MQYEYTYSYVIACYQHTVLMQYIYGVVMLLCFQFHRLLDIVVICLLSVKLMEKIESHEAIY